MTIVANVTLSSLKQVLAAVKWGYPALFGLFHPHSLLGTKRVLAVLGGVDSTKVPGTDPLCWELIYGKFSDIFKKPGPPPEKAIKHKIDLLPHSLPLAER